MSKHIMKWEGTDDIVAEVELPDYPDDGSFVFIKKTEENLETFKTITDVTVTGLSLVERNVFTDQPIEVLDSVKKGSVSQYGANEGKHITVHASTVTTENPNGDRG